MLLRYVANKMLLRQFAATYVLLQFYALLATNAYALPPTFVTNQQQQNVPVAAFNQHQQQQQHLTVTPTAATITARNNHVPTVITGATQTISTNAAANTVSVVGDNGNDDLIASSSANLLLDGPEQQTATVGQIANLTRHHDGDIFYSSGVASCTTDTCVGLSSGTAGFFLFNELQDDTASQRIKVTSRHQKRGGERFGIRDRGVAAIASGSEHCQCRCLPYLSTYREDLGICVDDIHECTLSPFVSGSSSEKIPFVFLPLRGQIIYPSREISFPDIRTPVCAVTGAQYLTSNGWSDLRNPIDSDYPFRMFRDEGRTFLQWLGEADLRAKMQGRLIVVHLVCRDMTLALNVTNKKDQLMPPKNVFSPCVAFRVNGSPVKYFHNVSEVLFQSEPTTTMAAASDGMTTKEYVVIGVCSLLLGLIYVSSVFLYLHMKKRKTREQSHRRNSIDDLANEINYPKNDQVTFGAPFNRTGSIYSATSLGTSNEPRSRTSIGSLKDDIGIVKNNPLLQHYPQLNDHHSGFTSDISNSNSECEMEGSFHDKIKQLQTSALVHPQMSGSNGSAQGMQANGGNGNGYNNNGDESSDTATSPTQENECLPIENVSIVEDMMSEEKLENLRAMVNGNVRKKLYFNPAYFEPHLLMQPPPAAIEFLQKIREVIAIAKYKMATKRFQPSLIMIPEEAPLRSGTPSLYGSTAPVPSGECQGCANNRCSGHVKNCGDKRNSIEKWLEAVTNTDDQKTAGKETNHFKNTMDSEQNQEAENSKQMRSANKNAAAYTNGSDRRINNCKDSGPMNRKSPRKEITPPKQRPPPPPTPGSHRSQQQASQTSVAAQRTTSVLEITNNSSQISERNAQADNNKSPTQTIHAQKVSIPVNRCYESFSALAAAVNVYGFAGSEIYNNPKFNLHESPNASQRSRGSSHRSKSPKRRLDFLELYATASTPTSLNSMDRQHYNMLRNMQKQQMLMDPHYDFNGSLKSNGSFHLNIPTPDYDSTMEKKIRDIYNNTQSSGPSVPTPDYSTLSRKSLRQYQPPDSPIYRRKSPQYLIVDYETDSLERLEATKRKSSHSSSSPSSDVSSQLSPSLSTALPLEEELEISHTVFDKTDGFRRDTDCTPHTKANGHNSTTEHKDAATRIKYDTPFRGSMTIEVEHEPQSDMERSTDSDQFEPDTLDRKPKKQSFCDVNAWSGQLPSSPPTLHSLPDMSNQCESLPPTYTNVTRASFILRARSNSFHKQDDKAFTRPVKPLKQIPDTASTEEEPIRPKLGSLRDLYDSQSQLSRQNSQSSSCRCGNQLKSPHTYDNLGTEQGRLLTLEAKHTRRQKNCEIPEPPPPPVVEITKVTPNKTTIKISTPKVNRSVNTEIIRSSDSIKAHVHAQNNKYIVSTAKNQDVILSGSSETNDYYDQTKNYEGSTPSSTRHITVSKSKYPARAKPPPAPPPPPPPISVTATLNNQNCQVSNGRNSLTHFQTTNHNGICNAEDDNISTHSESTELTRISDTLANSEFDGSCHNTLEPKELNKIKHIMKNIDETTTENESDRDVLTEKTKILESPISPKKINNEKDFGAIFNTKINGLRTDYSLTKYLNRRKTSSASDKNQDSDGKSDHDTDSQLEANNNLKNADTDSNKVEVLSVSSRSNRSSSRLSDRTKEMYRNAGVPVGIAYPQRSSVSNGVTQSSTTNVQTVYRCEIEPMQLTQGMQIAMGLKDRAKKAKDLKNAWKKFVNMAASKFSPTHSPAPPFDKKSNNMIETLERDEGISSLIDEHPQVSSPKSSISAPTRQNYYEQRFGTRLQEMDSGYMSADSAEVYRRAFYDRYNFKMRSGRDQIIRIDTIEDNSDGASITTDQYNGTVNSSRRNSVIENERFADLEHMSDPPANEFSLNNGANSDADSDKTITEMRKRGGGRNAALHSYSSEDEHAQSQSCGSSETDGETNGEDMWESGAESIETHSVLYRNVRNP